MTIYRGVLPKSADVQLIYKCKKCLGTFFIRHKLCKQTQYFTCCGDEYYIEPVNTKVKVNKMKDYKDKAVNIVAASGFSRKLAEERVTQITNFSSLDDLVKQLLSVMTGV